MNLVFLPSAFLRKACLVLIFLVFIISYRTTATHLRAGDISVVRAGEGCSYTTIITVNVYTNTKNTTELFGDAYLYFGDGKSVHVDSKAGKIEYTLAADGSIASAYFTVTHSYTGPGRYTISYSEKFRNGNVVNIDNPLGTEFYIETTVLLEPKTGECNQPLLLTVPPINRGCEGIIWTHNPFAYDPDGDGNVKLIYELVVPYQGKDQPVNGYKDPSTYGTQNAAGNGPPTFSIDNNGLITWDAPVAGKTINGEVQSAEYNIAFIVREIRTSDGVELSHVRRDMQIIIDKCIDNTRPELIIPEDICVVAGTVIDEDIIGTDKEDDVIIRTFSDLFTLEQSQTPPTLKPSTPTFRPSPSTLNFKWNTKCSHIRAQPYKVLFEVTDKSVNELSTFKTWSITVVGPPPEWKTAVLDVAKSSTALEWENYQCQNATTMEIWRRVDDAAFTPDECQTGMPENLGYELIDQVPLNGSNNKYTDTNKGKGLAPGAKYCYRLVAIYPSPGGGKSYVSPDICVGPIENDSPIITNVSVDSTDVTAGKIAVRWVKSPIVLGSPTYKVYRGLGFTGGASTLVYTGADTSFVDMGLNTKEKSYNYLVVSNGTDSSAVASSVRLETQSALRQIQLNWKFTVPWSNEKSTFPSHFIYRGIQHDDGSTRFSDLALIDSVNVTQNGFTYVDKGQYNDTPLQDKVTYCYAVVTQGTYGNDNLEEPLINYSQVMCTQPGDSIAPCKLLPPLRSTFDFSDCEDYFLKNGCNNSFYRNIITWSRPEDEDCRDDIFGYKIFFTSQTDGKYIELSKAGIVKDTFYIDTLFTSYARCYKIAAVDRSGNVGELSEPLCIDNCFYYELPNVFTPNGDDCNKFFSAYSDRNFEWENAKCPISDAEKQAKCPRFARTVSFRVYNRWGKEVYTYIYRANEADLNDGTNGVFIDWDGRDNHGVELASAVYYYMAEVTFITVNPSDKVKAFKGWIHLVR